MPSYEKSKQSGLWSVRFREHHAAGKVIQKRLSGFKTKKDAQYGYQDYLQEKGVTKDGEEFLFSHLVAQFIDYKKSRIKETSFYDFSKRIQNRIAPFFGKMPVSQITPVIILEWQKTIEKYSYQYKKTLNSQLSAIFNYAERYHDITSPMKKVERPRNMERKKEMLFWTADEFSKFIEHVPRADHALFFKFLYITGCRRGEALALTWSDIDQEKNVVRINKNFSNKSHDQGKSYTITTPKNIDSNRDVHIPAAMTKELLSLRKQRKGTNFVFGGEDPFPPTTLDRVMSTAAESAGVKKIRIHDLRHSCASLLINEGVSIVSISHQLGHKDVKQTLNTYAHMMPNEQEKIAKTFEKIMQNWNG